MTYQELVKRAKEITGTFQVVNEGWAEMGEIRERFKGTYYDCIMYMKRGGYRNMTLIDSKTGRFMSWVGL